MNLAKGLGEKVYLKGPNGSGKSSLIKTITRELYPVPEREDSWLRILGRDSWNIFELRSLIGIVSQDWMQLCTCAFPAGEIVLSGFFGSVGVWPYHHVTSEMERKAEAVMELLEIEHLKSRPTAELSSGEARRVVIGRALVHDPKALVLDEPTNSLDLHATRELRETMRRIAQDGTGLILVTHHLPDITPEIDRVILLRGGRVAGDGPTGEMLTGKRLTELFGSRVEVGRHEGYFHAW
jgi:iron complex transport system ATP-binding protein